MSLGFSRWLLSSRCHQEACSRAGRDADVQRGRLLQAWALGFPSLQLHDAGTGPRGLVHQPMHWGWCLQTPGDISCSTIFIIADLFAIKC